MNRSALFWGLGTSLAVATVAVARPAAAQGPSTWPGLPELPAGAGSTTDPEGSTPGASAAGAPVTPPAGLTPAQLYERIRRGVVALERNGVPMAVGTVLAGDGRVLTALSGLGGGDGADVRYADGTVVHARIGRSDKAADLALLVPQSTTWTDGLAASEVEPLETELRAMLPSRGARLTPTSAAVRGMADAHGRGGEALAPMLDVDLKGIPVAGAPLLDVAGGVVAVLVRACKGAAPEAASEVDNTPPTAAKAQARAAPPRCQPVAMGAPISTIRAFLTRPTPAPWLGIRGEQQSGAVRGVRVLAVAPASPAEKASLKASDVIVAVDGSPIDTPDKLSTLIGKHAPGDAVKLLLFGQDRFREAVVALRVAPSP